MPFVKQHLDTLVEKENTCAEYLITDDNIREECDRNEGIQVSFNFALCWLKHEISKILVNFRILNELCQDYPLISQYVAEWRFDLDL